MPTIEEVFEHYGYDPETPHRETCACCTPAPEDINKILKQLPGVLEDWRAYNGADKKFRVTLDHDPEYERALLQINYLDDHVTGQTDGTALQASNCSRVSQ